MWHLLCFFLALCYADAEESCPNGVSVDSKGHLLNNAACCPDQGEGHVASNSDTDQWLVWDDGETVNKNQGAVCRQINYVLLAVSGTLEEGFELRKNLDYRPNGDTGAGRVNATFLGNALVRGYKSFLDIKNPTWREYKGDAVCNDPGPANIKKTVNPALVPTGCDEHANRYAIYAVDARQAINALAGEPRFLSIAPDMGLADLSAADDLTFPSIKALANQWISDREDETSCADGSPFNRERIAFLTVTSTWLKSTFVPNGVIRVENGETEPTLITDYPVSTGIWSKVLVGTEFEGNYTEGCGACPTGGPCAQGSPDGIENQPAVPGVVDATTYGDCIDRAIQAQEALYESNDDGEQTGEYTGFEFCSSPMLQGREFGLSDCFMCQRLARYGVDKVTQRLNKPFEACELEAFQVAAGVTKGSDPKRMEGPLDCDSSANDDCKRARFPLQGCSLGFPSLE